MVLLAVLDEEKIQITLRRRELSGRTHHENSDQFHGGRVRKTSEDAHFVHFVNPPSSHQENKAMQVFEFPPMDSANKTLCLHVNR